MGSLKNQLPGKVCSSIVVSWAVAHQASLSMVILQARILEWVAMPSSRRSSQSRDQTQVSPTLQADSLPSEPPGKPVVLYLAINARYGASQVALVVKNPLANAEDVRDTSSILGSGRPQEEGMATHSSILV